MLETGHRHFDEPDETRSFERGRFDVVTIGGMTLGRASYNPGWKWSVHVGAALGKRSCDVEHVGLVLSGRAAVAMDDGHTYEIKSGDLFHIAPGHYGWVLGGEPYISLHLIGAGEYASRGPGRTARRSQRVATRRPRGA